MASKKLHTFLYFKISLHEQHGSMVHMYTTDRCRQQKAMIFEFRNYYCTMENVNYKEGVK